MRDKSRALSLITLLILSATFATAAGRRDVRDVSPTELQAEVAGRTVTVMLKDGRHFEAQVVDVTNQAMRVRITKSNLNDYASGSEREVNFADLGTIGYVAHKGKSQWLLPLIVGGVGGAVFGAAVNYCNNEPGVNCPTMKAATGATAAGATAAAAYGGYRMSRVEVQLRVRP